MSDCGDVPEIEHGNITLYDNTTYGSQANVSCNPGFTAEPSNITCQISGHWDNVTCIRTGIFLILLNNPRVFVKRK